MTVAALQHLREGDDPPLEPFGDEDLVIDEVGNVVATARANGVHPEVRAPQIVWADELAKPVGPPEWVCKDLRIARGGRPTVVAGENASKKSFLTMALAIAGASGRRLFGIYEIAPGLSWLYLDYESGRPLCQRRGQRIARGMGVELGTLGRSFGYAFRPFAWDASDARDQLLALTSEVDVVVVDPLTACTAGVDENSSYARAPLNLAIEVTAATGCTFVFVDHAGKPPNDGSTRKRKHAQRGHSSKADASQTLLVLSAEKGEPALVSCEREQTTGSFFPDFRFDVEDVASADGKDPQWALRLKLLSTEPKPSPAVAGNEKFAALKDNIVAAVKAAGSLPSLNAIVARVNGGSKTTKSQALEELIAEGRLLQPGGKGSAIRAA